MSELPCRRRRVIERLTVPSLFSEDFFSSMSPRLTMGGGYSLGVMMMGLPPLGRTDGVKDSYFFVGLQGLMEGTPVMAG